MNVRIPTLLCTAILVLPFTGPSAQEPKLESEGFTLFAEKQKIDLRPKLRIEGLRIFTEEELIEKLDLRRFEKGTLSPAQVIQAIEDFYRKDGYPLVTVYEVDDESVPLKLFVDEGRIGKILLLKTDTLNLFWMRYKLSLKGRIYNSRLMEKNMSYYKDQQGYKGAYYILKPAKNFDAALFQIDRMTNIRVIGKGIIPIFDYISPQYDLEIFLYNTPRTNVEESYSLDEGDEGDSELSFSVNIHYTKGFLPRLKFNQPDLLAEGDAYAAALSLGLMYGLDGVFDQLPKITFVKLEQNYMFAPMFGGIFMPHLRALLYYSNASREDLGLLSYNYLLFNTLFAPGITLLSRFFIYTGAGVEVVRFFRSTADPEAETYINIERRTDAYSYIEAGLTFNTMPIRLGDPIKNYLNTAYDYYIFLDRFHVFRVGVNVSFEMTDRSIITSLVSYETIWGSPPFHHEISVSSSSFKGFRGQSYYSRGAGSFSNEILVSLYRDYLYAGAYFDMTVFTGSGRDLDGIQYGIVGGPTVRVLMLDQLEFYIYYGWDYLYSNGESNQNISFNIYKKF